MMKKSKKPFLNMDERNKQIALKVIAIMYFFTIMAIIGIVIYRQFILAQDISNYEDIAIIVTINSIFLISALLYYGALPIRKLKVRQIVLFYIALVVLGFVFTYAKYNIFQSPGLSFEQLFDKLKIIATIIGLLMGFWIILSCIGKKRIDKELE